MSTSLLYHAFGIRGYEYRRTDFVEGQLCFTIEQPRERYRCPSCDSAAVHAQCDRRGAPTAIDRQRRGRL